MKTLTLRLTVPIFLIFAKAPVLTAAPAHDFLADSIDAFSSSSEGTTSFRSLSIPSGGRCECLGTAGAALSDDISFFDYNPAASAVLEQTEAVVCHNTWIADSAVETVAYTTRFGNFGTGAQIKCFYVPFTEYDNYGERAASSYYSETVLTVNAAYTFLAGYTFKGITAGINGKIGWRSVPDYTDSETGALKKNSGLTQSSLAVMGDAGLLMGCNLAKFFSSREPNVHIALTAQNIGAAFTGFGEKITEDDSLPWRIGAGISYRPVRALLITTEFRQYLLADELTDLKNRAACAGCELTVTPSFSFLTGFLLQGGSPRISIGSGFSVHAVLLHLAYTFDITSSQNPVNHISLSAKLRLGDGGRAEIQKAVDEHYIRGISLYAEGSRESIEAAIEEWTEALRLNRKFDPALQAKKAAEELLAAHDDITSLGKLHTR
ncbi:MAG: UPF0164 family protein [Treponema sp.]|nr:UPF0164 family protein [Treponema sp.]